MATSDSNAGFADGFSSTAFPERRSEILKKFNDLKNRNSRDMFFERPLGGDWPASRAFSQACKNDQSPFPSKYATKEIPIKVVHEKKNNEDLAEHNSPNSSFGSSSGKHEAKIEPRVHHIPIKVEPRGDSNTDLSRSPSASSQRSADSAASIHSVNDSASSVLSTSPRSNGSVGSSAAAKEHIIPITVESNVKPIPKRAESPLSSQPIKLKKVPPTPGQSQSTRSKNVTPKSHVTRVSVNQREDCDEDSPRGPSNYPKQHTVTQDPLQLIAMITEEVSSLQKQVTSFSGEYQDKTYLYLDEMLTRCMLKLDNIEVNGREDVRLARKSAIKFINDCIAALEAKVNKVKVNIASVDELRVEESSEATNEPEISRNDHNACVSNTMETSELEGTCPKVDNDKAGTEAVEIGDDQVNREDVQREGVEKMSVDECPDEAQEPKEMVDQSKNEEQKINQKK